MSEVNSTFQRIADAAIAYIPEDAQGLLLVKVKDMSAVQMNSIGEYVQHVLRKAEIKCQVLVVDEVFSFEMLTANEVEAIGFKRIDAPDYLSITKDVV